MRAPTPLNLALLGAVAPVRAQEELIGPPAPGAPLAEPAPAPFEIASPVDGAIVVGLPLSETTESLPLGASESVGLLRARADRADEPGDAGVPSPGVGAWRTIVSLVVVTVAAAGLAWLVRAISRGGTSLASRLGPGGRAPAGLLEVLGRYPLARAHQLVLLRLDRRVLLVSQQGGGMRTLCEVTDPEEVASILVLAGEAEGSSLAAKFRSAMSGFERAHADNTPEFASVGASSSLRARLQSMRDAEHGEIA